MIKNKLGLGDQIPSFKLKNQRGEFVHILPTDRIKRVIYFYPKNNTRKCTEEACSFRDWQDDFLEKGFQVIGISPDTVKSHQRFEKKHQLNFTLLSDNKGEVRKLFGATDLFGLITSRKTFIVSEDGKIEFVHQAFFEGKEHVEKLIAFLNKS